jgi:hypothetical protein
MDEFNNLVYVIFDASELPSINFNEVLEPSIEVCRLSVDQTKTVVKWYGPTTPTCVNDLLTKSDYYNHSEILEIMYSTEWTISKNTMD